MACGVHIIVLDSFDAVVIAMIQSQFLLCKHCCQ